MILKTHCNGSQDLLFKSFRRYRMVLMCHTAMFGGLGAQKVAVSRRAMQDLSATGDLESLRY
jgi:hypothetical protein